MFPSTSGCVVEWETTRSHYFSLTIEFPTVTFPTVIASTTPRAAPLGE